MAWEIVSYESKRGDKPVEEFIKSLNDITGAKVTHNLDLLEKYGYQLRMPHAKKIHKVIYELRIRGTEDVRILYVFKKRKIILLHGFKKKTNSLPGKEIEIAVKRSYCT